MKLQIGDVVWCPKDIQPRECYTITAISIDEKQVLIEGPRVVGNYWYTASMFEVIGKEKSTHLPDFL